MGYRLSDASNARNLVTSTPNVNQLRNVDSAVKIIYLGTAPTKIRKANMRTVIYAQNIPPTMPNVMYTSRNYKVMKSRGQDQSTPRND